MSPSQHLTREERFWRVVLYVASGLVLFFLMAPIFAIVPLSFNSGTFLTYPLDGLSLRWYEAFLASEQWMRALRNSFVIGIIERRARHRARHAGRARPDARRFPRQGPRDGDPAVADDRAGASSSPSACISSSRRSG